MTKKKIHLYILLFAVTYMVSYLTRINYGAIISAMETQTGFSKDSLSMALTGSFITYGAGQVVSGVLGDRFSPKKLVSGGLAVTVVMNMLLPFCGSPWFMCAVWCVNGFAQSFMWPPLVRIMSSLLDQKDYRIATVRVSWGSSVGTILLYLVSPLILMFLPWKWVFWICAGCGGVMLIIWHFAAPEIPTALHSGETEKKQSGGLFSPLMLVIMAAIVLMGMLKDGVTTWMPTYISETYALGDQISILSGVLLPLFSIFCFSAASWIYGWKMKNPVTCAALFFAVGAAAALGLYFLNGTGVISSALLAALLTGTMHGVNLMLISMIPNFFKARGNVSAVSGALNACTYAGSAISAYGVARLSESIGWNSTIFVWFLIAFGGMGLCLVCIPGWKKKFS